VKDLYNQLRIANEFGFKRIKYLSGIPAADEKGQVISSYPGANKKLHVREKSQEELFPKERNFK